MNALLQEPDGGTVLVVSSLPVNRSAIETSCEQNAEDCKVRVGSDIKSSAL